MTKRIRIKSENDRAAQRTYIKNTKAVIRKMKESEPCKDCRTFFPYYMMQYDHISDDKITNLRKIFSLPKALREIAKCELVCVNCHAERTHQRCVKSPMKFTPYDELTTIRKKERTIQHKHRDKIRRLKESFPCTDCNTSFPYYVIHYDHIGTKIRNVSTIRTINRAMEELKNCEPVCGNCHAVRTHTRELVRLEEFESPT